MTDDERKEEVSYAVDWVVTWGYRGVSKSAQKRLLTMSFGGSGFGTMRARSGLTRSSP